MTGIIVGAYRSGKVVKRCALATPIVSYGYLTMGVATAINLTYNAFLPSVVPWVILLIMLYAV